MGGVVITKSGTFCLLLMSWSSSMQVLQLDYGILVCQNVYVQGAEFEFLEGLYTPLTGFEMCELRFIYEHHAPGGDSFIRYGSGQWRITPDKVCTDQRRGLKDQFYHLGPAGTQVPYDVEWEGGFVTVVCIDDEIRLLKPPSSSVLSDVDNLSGVLTDNSIATCVTLPRSGIQPGSEYRVEMVIHSHLKTKLLVSGKNFSCNATSRGDNNGDQQCGVGLAVAMARLPAAQYGNYYKKYEFKHQATSGDITTCEFRVSCEAAGGCIGVVLTFKYEDFLGSNLEICDILPMLNRA